MLEYSTNVAMPVDHNIVGEVEANLLYFFCNYHCINIHFK